MRRAYLWLSFAVGFALLALLVFNIDWSGTLSLLSRAKPHYLALYAVATAVILALSALRWQVIARSKGIVITFVPSVSYSLARFAVSFVTPGPRVGGDAVAAGLVTRHRNGRRKASYGESLSIMAIDRMVELQTFAFLFFVWVLVLALFGTIAADVKIFLITFSGFFLAMMLVAALSVMKGKLFFTRILKRFVKKRGALREIDRFESTLISFYRTEPRAFFIAHAVAALAWLLSIVEYYAILRALGFELPLYAVFIIFVFVGLAYALPVPLALGTLETAQAIAFTIIGLPPVGGIILAFVTRVRDLLISAVGFIILAYHGILPHSR